MLAEQSVDTCLTGLTMHVRIVSLACASRGSSSPVTHLSLGCCANVAFMWPYGDQHQCTHSVGICIGVPCLYPTHASVAMTHMQALQGTLHFSQSECVVQLLNLILTRCLPNAALTWQLIMVSHLPSDQNFEWVPAGSHCVRSLADQA